MLNQVPQNVHVPFLGKQLFPVSQPKYLGIILDASMTFDDACYKCDFLVYRWIMSNKIRAKYIFDKQTLIVITNALIFSKLYYGSTIWSKNVKKLQLVQNFAARIVSGSIKYKHITPVLRQLNWLPVSYMLQSESWLCVFDGI